MGIKFIFVTFCIGTIVLVITILKTDFMESAINVESKYSYKPSYRDTGVSKIAKFIIEPKCKFNFITWIVTSSANDPSYRRTLRHAYPNKMLKHLNITRVFLLGIPKEENVQNHILKESQQYGDLLQGDFLEDYRNLTLKHLMGLKWAAKNCESTFLMKSDNDIVLDIFEILRLMQQRVRKRNIIYGYVLKKMKPMRVSNNKWFVSMEDYSGNIYPDFLSGWFYITTLEVAHQLVSASAKYEHFFWIDDVFITGFLRQECGIEFADLKSMYATDYRYLECCIHGSKRKLKCEFTVGPDGGRRELHIKFKEFSEFCQENCLKRTKKNSVLKTCVSAYEEKISAVNSRAEVHYI